MSRDITPPADAPLPWRYLDDAGQSRVIGDGLTDHRYIVDANNDAVVFVDDDLGGAITYLVAAANAAPGLVAERDAAREQRSAWMEVAQKHAEAQKRAEAALDAEFHRGRRVGLDTLSEYAKRITSPVVEAAESQRDAALARVAALEARLARQAPVIEAARDWLVATPGSIPRLFSAIHEFTAKETP